MTETSTRLHVVHADPGALEDAFLARLATLRSESPLEPIDVLVGGVLQRPYLQRLIAETSPGLLNIRFSTLGELGVSLGEPALAASSRRALPAMAERAYVAEAARGCGGYFSPVATTPGFAEAARRLLRELRQEQVAPEALAARADQLESADKADDLVALYRRYLDGRAGYYDGVDALAGADAERFDGIELLIVGIWRLPAAGRVLVERIATRVPVTVFLPSVGGDADDAHLELRRWLEDCGTEVSHAETERTGTSLAALQANLFSPSAETAADETVALVSAPEPLAETKEAARACLAWAAQGIPFRQMAVTYRQAELYRPLVEAVFAEAGIPVYLDDGPSLAERPLGRRILALIDLIESPLRRPDVMAFLSDGRMPKATRERFGGAPAARWDSASRRAGVVQGVDQWHQRLTLLREEEQAWADEEGAPEWRARRVEDCDSLLAFIGELGERVALRPERTSWSEGLAYLGELLRTYVDKVDDVLGYLDTLAQLDAIVPEIDFSRFLEIVRAEVQALKAGDLDDAQQGAFGRRGVNVLDVNQLRGLRFDAVCILGLTERSFPPPPRQDPLLLDAERSKLNAAGDWTLPLRALGADPEPLQFALAVHAARERLFLSTRRAEEAGGRIQLPSGFFRAAVAALEGRRVKIDEVERSDHVRRLPAGRVGAASLADALTLPERDRTLLELEPELGRAVLAELEPRTLRTRALREARLRKRTLTEFDGVLVSEEAREGIALLLAEGRPRSATGLENYANCPLKYFYSEILRLRPLEEPAEILEIDALDRGKGMHDILHLFVEALGEAALEQAHRPTLEEIADRVLAELEARGRTGAALLWEAHRQAILDDLAGWFERELMEPLPYAKRMLEVSFGDPPLRLTVGGHELRVGGRIDRLDHDKNRFRVVDYKTGKALKSGEGMFAGGRALQLPLYLLAGAQILGLDAENGEAAYHYFSRGEFKRIAFTGEHLVERRADLDAVLERIATGIAEGDFHAEPDDWACRYCDYNAACDVGRSRIRERKAKDARIASFAEMREIK